METFKFTVIRSKWRSGGDGEYSIGRGGTKLLNENGYFCCLGFACKSLGILDSQMMNIALPSSLGLSISPLVKFDAYNDRDSEFTQEAAYINDTWYYTQQEREEKLIELGKKYNIDITFID